MIYVVTDSSVTKMGHIIDATRLSDGKYVTLKRVKTSVHPYEVDIGLYFSTTGLASDTENHCVPFYEILSLDDDETIIIVMPLLRSYSDPPFDTFGEVIECFRQLFEVGYDLYQLYSLTTISRDYALCISTTLRIGALK